MQRVLIVEDESRLLHHLNRIFDECGFSVMVCADFLELDSLIEQPACRFDLVVLDRMLQGRDAAELLPKWKSHFPGGKVMILSAVNSAAERASLLDLGADDYVGKPFDSSEVIARARALLRRGKADLALGNLVLDSLNRRIKVGGMDVSLTNKEFLLMRTLLQSPGKVFNKAYLYDDVWGFCADTESNVVETTVNKLRRRLKELGADVMIKNARNLGYWIEK